MMRKSLKAFMLSDGTVIPRGALIFTAAQANHSIHPNPDLFDGFRFSNLEKVQQGNDPRPLITANLGGSIRFKLVATTPDYFVWGYGKHACSGRFFAALLLKLVLAHFVLRYDVKFENGGRPEDVIVGFNQLPNPHGKVWLRKRR
jgi:cytochrome P450